MKEDGLQSDEESKIVNFVEEHSDEDVRVLDSAPFEEEKIDPVGVEDDEIHIKSLESPFIHKFIQDL